MKKVLVLGKIVDSGLEILRGAPKVDYIELPQHAPDLMEYVPTADAIIVRMTKITAEVISAAPNLKIVARHGVGFEAVDVPALTASGVPLAIVGNVNALAVAEHTLAMMLGMAKKLRPYDIATRTGDFSISDSFSATELYGKTILLAGFGRIGQEVAQRCKAFGMTVVISDPFVQASVVESAGYKFASNFKVALSSADWVSIHIPKTPETENFISAQEMAAMKQGSYLVNVSRGGMVDEVALSHALKSGHLRGAALDVFDPEPPGVDNPLFELENFLVSPHCGAFTEECAQRMSSACASNVLAAFEGNLDPALIVNKEVLKN